MKVLKNKNTYTTFMKALILSNVVVCASCKHNFPEPLHSPSSTTNAGQTTQAPIPITNEMIQTAKNAYWDYPLAKVLKALQAGLVIDIDQKDSMYDYTALHEAAKLGREDIIKALLSRHAKVDIEGKFHMRCTPLFLAAEEGHLAVVKALLGAGARKDKSNGESCNIARSKLVEESSLTPEKRQEYLDVITELEK